MTFPLMPFPGSFSSLGESWSAVGDIPASIDLWAVSGGTSGEFIVSAEAGAMYKTEDYGDTWDAVTSFGSVICRGSVYRSGYYYMSQDSGNIVSRTNNLGATWNNVINSSRDNRDINFNDGYFILGSGAPGGNGYQSFSTDGVTWNNSPTTGANSSICGIYVAALNRTISLGVQNKYRNGIPSTAAWTGSCTGLAGTVNAVAWSPEQDIAVCVSTNGNIYSSTNLIAWTSRKISTGAVPMNDVIWAANMFVAVGDDGLIYTSGNGVDWVSRASGTSENLMGISYASDTIIVTGDAGTVLRSQ